MILLVSTYHAKIHVDFRNLTKICKTLTIIDTWNLHGYGPVVMVLEQFEVQLPETVPPLTFWKMSPTHEGW